MLPKPTPAVTTREAIRSNLQTQDVVARYKDSPRRVTPITRWNTPPDLPSGVSPFHCGQLSPLSDEGRRRAVEQVTASASPEHKPLESWWDDFIREQGLESANMEPDRMLADPTQSSPTPDSPTPLPRPLPMPAAKRGMGAVKAAEALENDCHQPIGRSLSELPQEGFLPSAPYLVQCLSPLTVTPPPDTEAQLVISSQVKSSSPIDNNPASGGLLGNEFGYGTLHIEVESEPDPEPTDLSGLNMLASAALGQQFGSRAASFDPNQENSTTSVMSIRVSIPTEVAPGVEESAVEIAQPATKQESIATPNVIARDQPSEAVENLSRPR